jgi:hypothetical protein
MVAAQYFIICKPVPLFSESLSEPRPSSVIVRMHFVLRLSEAEQDFLRAAMFNGVGDCLLSNAIKMRGHDVVLDGDKPVATKFTANPEKVCGIIRKLLQRHHQTV